MNTKDSGYIRPEYPHSAQTAGIIKAAYAVHNVLGPGFREVIYQRALEHELKLQGLACVREVALEVEYKGICVGQKRVDLVVGDVLVELKAVSDIEPVYLFQLLSYLKVSKQELGLLLNFGGKSLQVRRVVNQKR
ncbi:MAG: GxxExxY protein [Anaerolineales bacterium]|nr:GxxExxY protein [Anaerolineales bacterium]